MSVVTVPTQGAPRDNHDQLESWSQEALWDEGLELSDSGSITEGHDWLDTWFQDDWELDSWEKCRFLVPEVAAGLKQCERTNIPDTMFRLESTPWKVSLDIEQQAADLAAEHRFMCLAVEEDEFEEPGKGNDPRDAAQLLTKACEVEKQLHRVSKCAWDAIVTTGSTVVEGIDKLELGPGSHAVRALRAFGADVGQSTQPKEDDVPEEEYLQTRLVSVDEVRRDLTAWKPSMVEEYTSLVHTTGTCEPLDQEQFLALTSDPGQKVEVLPGKLVFSIKAKSGRKKTRAVGCGNFQKGCPRDKLDKHASGISAEAIRLMIRFAGQAQWTISTTDIKTAFLNAPLVTPNEEKIVIKVPGIFRAANVCQEPYWLVRKALYGLDVAPRSWTLHRNQVLSSIAVLADGTPVSCKQTKADANLWEVTEEQNGKVIAFVGVYVDDLLLVSPEAHRAVVMETLRNLWTTSDPEVVAEDREVSFAGYEIRQTRDSFRIHQRSYILEMLNQWEIEEESEVPCVKEPPQVCDRSQSAFELTKQAQSIAGQLLWISTHSRPDVCYAVQAVCHQISTNPAGACDAGVLVMQYLKRTLHYELNYGLAPENYGIWNELQFKRGATLVEIFTDASFCPDDSCKSFQSAMMFWGGCLVMWAGSRQSLIAASTAEAELISMVEGYSVGRAFIPTIEALCRGFGDQADDSGDSGVGEKVLYGDNAAAIQLTQLDAGAWRTRHLRLRGAVLRQAVEDLGWRVVHLPGLYMPADLGTKVLGPNRFNDLINLMNLREAQDQTTDPRTRSQPKVAQALVLKILLAVLVASQTTVAEAHPYADSIAGAVELTRILAVSFFIGLGGSLGVAVARWIANKCLRPKPNVKGIGPSSLKGSTNRTHEDSPSSTRSERPLTRYGQGSHNESRQRGRDVSESPHRGPTEEPYQPTYEDLVAAYPQQLSEMELLHGRLRDSERLCQEYMDRCAQLQTALQDQGRSAELVQGHSTPEEEGQGMQAGSSNELISHQSAHDFVFNRIGHRESWDVIEQNERTRRGGIETREPTVAPPPRLIALYAGNEAWVVQRPGPGDEDGSEGSELGGATTSSGEYTIKERSSDSSGGYQADVGLVDQGGKSPVGRRSTRLRSSGAATGLAATVVGQALGSAEGAICREDQCAVTSPAPKGDGGLVIMIFMTGCLVGCLVGVVGGIAWRRWCSRVQDHSSVHVSITNAVNLPGDSHPEGPVENRGGGPDEYRLPRAPRRSNGRRQRFQLYLTSLGDCVHLTDQCTTLSGSQVQTRTVCQRCAHFPLSLH